MGIAIPQVITSDRATGASIIDGSLKFDGGKSTHLTRTPSIAGNRKTWTWSSWIKRTKFGFNGRILRINPLVSQGYNLRVMINLNYIIMRIVVTLFNLKPRRFLEILLGII